MKTLTFDQLKEIAARKSGFSVDSTGKEITKGVAVAITNGTNNFNIMTPEEVHFAVVNSHDNLGFGGWSDKDGNFYLDAIVVFPMVSAAKNFAKLHNQRAIFDITNGVEISI